MFRYILSLPFRVAIAAVLLLVAFVSAFAIVNHLAIASWLKQHGQETTVLVLKRVQPSGSSNSGFSSYYVLRFPNGEIQNVNSHDNYPVGKSMTVMFSPEPPTFVELPFNLNMGVRPDNLIVRGKKSSSIAELYFSSSKKNLQDSGLAHSVIACYSTYLAIRIIFTPYLLSKLNVLALLREFSKRKDASVRPGGRSRRH